VLPDTHALVLRPAGTETAWLRPHTRLPGRLVGLGQPRRHARCHLTHDSHRHDRHTSRQRTRWQSTKRKFAATTPMDAAVDYWQDEARTMTPCLPRIAHIPPLTIYHPTLHHDI